MADSNHNAGASSRQHLNPPTPKQEPRKEHPDRAKARREVLRALDRHIRDRGGRR